MLIDEVQRVPGLWLAIKNSVDRDPTPGRFILTGSARLLALQSLPDALPGRSEAVELWPLSQGEIDGGPDGFVDAVFSTGTGLTARVTQLRRSDYLSRISRGVTRPRSSGIRRGEGTGSSIAAALVTETRR